MKPIRVISVYPYFANCGGAQNVTLQLATKLNTETPVVLVETPLDRLPQRYKTAARYEKFSIRRVYQYAGRNTVFISHHRKSTLKLMLMKTFFPKKIHVIHVAHSTFTDYKWLGWFPDKVVAISHAVADNLRDFFHVEERKIKLIYDGLEDRYKGRRIRTDDNQIRILMAGKICPLKQQVKLARHLSKGLDSRVQLFFAGEGPDADNLIETIGNHQQLHYLGQIDMEQHIEDYDYLLLFSEKEGLPLVLIEACMHGIPMITNAIPAVLEINEDKRTGYVFEDMDKLLAGINHLPKPHSEAYQEMSQNARKKFENFFREETMIKAYKELIRNTIYP